jgi:hypothetical protein
METRRDKIPANDNSGIPELDDAAHPTIGGRVRRIERNIVNAFTVERDTSLAEGAGPPGSTEVGGQRQERNRK